MNTAARIAVSVLASIALYGAPLSASSSSSWQVSLAVGCILAFAFGVALGTWWWCIVAATPALLTAVVMLALLSGEADEGGWGKAIWQGGLVVAIAALAFGSLGVLIAKRFDLGLFKSTPARSG